MPLLLILLLLPFPAYAQITAAQATFGAIGVLGAYVVVADVIEDDDDTGDGDGD